MIYWYVAFVCALIYAYLALSVLVLENGGRRWGPEKTWGGILRCTIAGRPVVPPSLQHREKCAASRYAAISDAVALRSAAAHSRLCRRGA